MRLAGLRYEFEWRELLDELDKMKMPCFDYSRIPGPHSDILYYNGCLHVHFKVKEHMIILLISAFFTSYNVLVIKIDDPKASLLTIWHNYPENIQLKYNSLKHLLKKVYPDYIELPYELVTMQVPEFSMQAFAPGEARVLHYLYTLLSLYDDILW